MNSRLLITGTLLMIIGLIGLAIRLFFSKYTENFGLADVDIICILIPMIFIIFGFVLFFVGWKGTDDTEK